MRNIKFKRILSFILAIIMFITFQLKIVYFDRAFTFGRCSIIFSLSAKKRCKVKTPYSVLHLAQYIDMK